MKLSPLSGIRYTSDSSRVRRRCYCSNKAPLLHCVKGAKSYLLTQTLEIITQNRFAVGTLRLIIESERFPSNLKFKKQEKWRGCPEAKFARLKIYSKKFDALCTDALHVKVMKTKSPLDMCVCVRVLHHHMTGDRVKL